MPIIGLTDQKEPRFVRFGKIRKGGQRPSSGDRPGRDLDHFRVTFEPEWAEKLEAPFRAKFGSTPRVLPVMLLGSKTDDCFTAWYEAWTATALQSRCDGHTKAISIVDGRYVHGLACTKGPSAIGNDDKTFACGCRMIGRLAVGIPDVWDFPGVSTPGIFVMETHSVHDIIRLSQRLKTIEAMYGSLSKVQLKLFRKEEKISHYESGTRKLRKSWLVNITEHLDQYRMLGSGQPGNSLPATRVYDESPAPGRLPSTTKPAASAPAPKAAFQPSQTHDGGYMQFLEEEQSWAEKERPPKPGPSAPTHPIDEPRYDKPPPRPTRPAFPPPFDKFDFRAIIKITRNVRRDTNPNAPKYHLIDAELERFAVWTLTPLAQMFAMERHAFADWIGHDRPLEQPLYIRVTQGRSGQWGIANDQVATLQNPAIALQFAEHFRKSIRLSGWTDKNAALRDMLGVDKITDSTLTITQAQSLADAWLAENTYIKADGTHQRGQFPDHPHTQKAAQKGLPDMPAHDPDAAPPF